MKTGIMKLSVLTKRSISNLPARAEQGGEVSRGVHGNDGQVLRLHLTTPVMITTIITILVAGLSGGGGAVSMTLKGGVASREVKVAGAARVARVARVEVAKEGRTGLAEKERVGRVEVARALGALGRLAERVVEVTAPSDLGRR